MKIGYLMQAGVPDIRQRPLSAPANHVWRVYKQLEVGERHWVGKSGPQLTWKPLYPLPYRSLSEAAVPMCIRRGYLWKKHQTQLLLV